MSLQDFITKWAGKGIDFDGAYGDQCMDLMHQYCVEVLGITDGRVLAAPVAKDVWLTDVYGKDKFSSIANSATGVPSPGDIVLFGTEIGTAGHVSIFVSGDTHNFISFDQNWNGHAYCEEINHGYGGENGVLGWLHFKGAVAPVDDYYKGYDLSNRESMKSAVDVLTRVLAGEFVDKSKYDQDTKGLQTTIDNLNQQIRDRDREILDLHGQVNSLRGEITTTQDELTTTKQLADLVPDLKKNLIQAQYDRTICLTAQTTQNKKIAQLQNTSYLTAPTTDLLKEVVQRVLRIKS